MFDTITSLAELNKEYAKIISNATCNITDLNNAYNAAKKRIALNKTTSYVELIKFTPIIKQFDKKSTVPILGFNPDKNKLVMTDQGFLI